MCLDYKMTKKDKKEWLKKQPEILTVYKAVQIAMVDDRPALIPIIFDKGAKPFQRINTLREVKSLLSEKREVTRYASGRPAEYVAYFHLYINKEDALGWTDGWSNQRETIECQVPKESITEVGEDGGSAIITRKFTIVGQDKYLK